MMKNVVGIFCVLIYSWNMLYKRPENIWILAAALGVAYCLGTVQSFPATSAVLLYLFWLAVTDWQTMYIPPAWIGYTFLFLLLGMMGPLPRYPLEGALFFSLPAFAMHTFKGWMGSADGWFLLVFGWLLGLERMLIAMGAALAGALIYSLFCRRRQIPFLSFLAAGYTLAYFRGYALYMFLAHLFW